MDCANIDEAVQENSLLDKAVYSLPGRSLREKDILVQFLEEEFGIKPAKSDKGTIVRQAIYHGEDITFSMIDPKPVDCLGVYEYNIVIISGDAEKRRKVRKILDDHVRKNYQEWYRVNQNQMI